MKPPDPDPGRAGTTDEIAAPLRQLNAWSGDPTFDVIPSRVNAGRRTAVFLNSELPARDRSQGSPI